MAESFVRAYEKFNEEYDPFNVNLERATPALRNGFCTYLGETENNDPVLLIRSTHWRPDLYTQEENAQMVMY